MRSVFRKVLSRSSLTAAFKLRVSVAAATLGFVLAACAAIVTLETSHVLDERAKELADGKRDTTNLVASLIQHADLTFPSADMLLLGIVERAEHDGIDGQA